MLLSDTQFSFYVLPYVQ